VGKQKQLQSDLEASLEEHLVFRWLQSTRVASYVVQALRRICTSLEVVWTRQYDAAGHSRVARHFSVLVPIFQWIGSHGLRQVISDKVISDKGDQ
jgi:hypothetical protein